MLSPDDHKLYRLVNVGRDRMPPPGEKGRARFWAFVQRVSRDAATLRTELEEYEYDTKTRGVRTQPSARPAGEGRYQIVRHGDHTHLVYALELPHSPGEVQDELHIAPQASYIVTVKNPEAPSPPRAGLPRDQTPAYPARLRDPFRGRKFADLDPPDFLDHEGTQLVLIAAAEDVEDELGLALDTERETASTAELFRDLHLRPSAHPLEPLFDGRWA